MNKIEPVAGENPFPQIGPLSGIPIKTEKYGEPWRMEYGLIIGGGDDETNSYLIGKVLDWQESENGRRIIACVNACAGIETEKLESGSPEWWGEYVKRDRPAMEREISHVRLERDELLAGIKALYRSYVNTIETARDLLVEFKYPCDPVEVMEKQNPALKAARDLIAKIEA